MLGFAYAEKGAACRDVGGHRNNARRLRPVRLLLGRLALRQDLSWRASAAQIAWTFALCSATRRGPARIRPLRAADLPVPNFRTRTRPRPEPEGAFVCRFSSATTMS